MPMFDLGDPVMLAFQATAVSGNLTNTTPVVTVTVTQPDGTTTTPAVINPSTGSYEAVFVPTQEGRHGVRWAAAGAEPSALSDAFDVYGGVSARYIVGLDDAKTLLRFNGTTETDDEIRRYNAATTDLIERYMNKTVVRRAIVGEEHCVDWHSWYRSWVFLRHRPVISLTSVVSMDGLTTWDTSLLHTDTTTGRVSLLPGSMALRGQTIWTYVAGYPVIPANIQEAARIVIQHLWATRRGLAGNLVTQQLPGFNIGFALPQSVKDLLGPPAPMVA